MRARIGPRQIGLTIAILTALVALAGGAAHLGYQRGVEAGFATGSEFDGVTCASHALTVLGYLRSDRTDRAIRTLDSTIDAGISMHWLRLQRPDRFADHLPPPTELVNQLADYRSAHPSTAASETPHMNRQVAEYLAYRDRERR